MPDSPLRLRPLWLTLGALWVVLVVWLSLTSSPPSLRIGSAFRLVEFEHFDKLAHLAVYAFLQGWFMLVYQHSLQRWRFAMSFVVLGIALEYLQGLGGVRHFEVLDMVANLFGVSLALLLVRPPLSQILESVEQVILGPAT